jgi:hypothetical protein
MSSKTQGLITYKNCAQKSQNATISTFIRRTGYEPGKDPILGQRSQLTPLAYCFLEHPQWSYPFLST